MTIKLLLIVGLFIVFIGCSNEPRMVVVVTNTPTPANTPTPTPTNTPIPWLTPVASVEEYEEICSRVAQSLSESDGTLGHFTEITEAGYQAMQSLAPPDELYSHERLVNALQTVAREASQYPPDETLNDLISKDDTDWIVVELHFLVNALSDAGCISEG